jgi:mRNA interferase MazF
MRRGEVWLARFDTCEGSEAAQTRPCVVVSADASNRVVERLRRGVVTVVPLTSNTRRVYPFQALVVPDAGNGLTVASKAQAEQVRALDHSRFVERLGTLCGEHLRAVEDALLVHLHLWRWPRDGPALASSPAASN